MEKPINKERAAIMETKQTTSGSNLVETPTGASEEHTAAVMTTMTSCGEYVEQKHGLLATWCIVGEYSGSCIHVRASGAARENISPHVLGLINWELWV